MLAVCPVPVNRILQKYLKGTMDLGDHDHKPCQASSYALVAEPS